MKSQVTRTKQIVTSLTRVVVTLAVLSPTVTWGVVLNLSGNTNDQSSEFNGSFSSSNAFDGNTASRWASAPNTTSSNEWIWVDLGEDLVIDNVRIAWELAEAEDYTIRTLTSADATTLGLAVDGTATGDLNNWTTVATVAGAGDRGTAPFSTYQDVFDFSGGSAAISGGATTATANVSPIGRYLLINPTVNVNAATNLYSIWEVEVSASPLPAPEPSAIVLAMFGLVGLGIGRRRNRHA